MHDARAHDNLHCHSSNGLRDGAVVKAIDGKPFKTWEEYKELAVGHPSFVMTVHYPRMTMWFAAENESKEIAARIHDVVVERNAAGIAGFALITTCVRALPPLPPTPRARACMYVCARARACVHVHPR